jgi:hypothetical protein
MKTAKTNLMTIVSITMLAGIAAQMVEMAYAKGGMAAILAGSQIVVLIFYCIPFCILWAAAFWSKGVLVRKTCIALGLFFIVLNYLFNVGFLSKITGETGQIITAAITSAEVLLPLIMVVCAIVSHARNEQKSS